MRYLLRAFWNEFQPTLDESIYQALCAKQIMFAEIGEISEKRLGSFWRNLLDNLSPERRAGKMMICRSFWTIQAVFITISAMTAHRELILPRRLSHIGRRSACRKNRKKPKNTTRTKNRRKNPNLGRIIIKKTEPADNSGGYYQFCKVQFKDGGSSYAYLTGGLPLAVGDFVLVPVGNRNAGKPAA